MIKHRPGKVHTNVDTLSRMPNSMPYSESREIEIDTTVCAVFSSGLLIYYVFN